LLLRKEKKRPSPGRKSLFKRKEPDRRREEKRIKREEKKVPLWEDINIRQE